MMLIKTPNKTFLEITRKELKYYLDESTESFLKGKTRILFPVEKPEGVDEVMVINNV